MNAIQPRAVNDYLRQLEKSLRGLPRSRRSEIVTDIKEHIDEALAGIESSEAEVRNVLARLGEPEDIALDAAERLGIAPVRPRASDVAAVILLLVGGLVLPVIGWFIGVALLWASAVFTTRDKLVGTLVLPGGLALPAFLLLFGVAFGVILLTLAALAPIATAVYLGRKLSSSRLKGRPSP